MAGRDIVRTYEALRARLANGATTPEPRWDPAICANCDAEVDVRNGRCACGSGSIVYRTSPLRRLQTVEVN